jgi:heavy metal sensor kinase
MAVAFSGFGAIVWFALNHSLFHAIDDSLLDRVEGVRQFIEAESGWLALEELREEFREHSVLGPGGDLFQVADADGNWLYRSGPLYDEHVPIYTPSDLGSTARFENLNVQGTPLRFLSRNVTVEDQSYTVQVAAPLSELDRGLREFLWVLAPALPMTLVVASVAGYWISRRALRPVDEITETARSMTADSLSRRLTVPRSADELERLAQTFNDMIERLESAFKRITRFTADASHELRTPIAVMRTTADVALRDSEASGSRQRDALEQIAAELERTSQLIDNLLLIARADSGEQALTLSRLDLAATIREACDQGAVLARAKGVTLDMSLPEQEMVVEGDQLALRRLFLLLIDNAVKYTPPGGRVEVSLVGEKGDAVARVRDSGIGISEKHLPHVFDRFYRVDKARAREQGGAGLGLSIGRWIVDKHGGSISAESIAGRGSVFTVRLHALYGLGSV